MCGVIFFVLHRTDIGIKHMINSTAEKEGVEGLIRVVQEGHEVSSL